MVQFLPGQSALIGIVAIRSVIQTAAMEPPTKLRLASSWVELFAKNFISWLW